MAIDGEIMFVGSFNFDQRSLNINAEIGILFHDPELAAEASKHFREHIEEVAFRVKLVGHDNGISLCNGAQPKAARKSFFDSEPYAGFWKVLELNLMRALPLDSMLSSPEQSRGSRLHHNVVAAGSGWAA